MNHGRTARAVIALTGALILGTSAGGSAQASGASSAADQPAHPDVVPGAAVNAVDRAPVAVNDTSYAPTNSGQASTDGSADGAAGQQSAAAAAAACPFVQRAEDVHISSTAFEASGHGYWTTTTTPSCQARTATVTVQLQQYYSDGSWRNAGAKGKSTGVRPGGGSGKRATGRAKCYTSTNVTWRSIVDVDIEGYIDGSSVAVSRQNTIPCRY